jgi:hypothetical protein
MGVEILQVDPKTLRLPASRLTGPDPIKFSRQLSRYWTSTTGMPLVEVTRGRGGELQIINGVTRASRVARLFPGQTIQVEVTETRLNLDLSRFPTLGEVLQ